MTSQSTDRPEGDGLRKAINQFEALRNAYRGYLPWDSDNTDVKTRLLQIEDMDTAFFVAIRSILPTRDAAEGAGKLVPPVCCYCDADLSCAKCGREQPADCPAPPKPAPDAMRQKLLRIKECVDIWFASGVSQASAIKRTCNEIAALSAPVLPADDPEPECAPMRFENEIDAEGFTISAKLVPVPPSDTPSDRQIRTLWKFVSSQQAIDPEVRDQICDLIMALLSGAGAGEPVGIAWRRVNGEPFEYAIQQGQHGDEFVKLLNGSCLRRPVQPGAGEREADPDLCAGGVNPGWEECPKCGATMDDECKGDPEYVAEDTSIGGVTWHSSEPDGGPDVGVSIFLGPNDRLWAGEISDQLFAEHNGAEKFDGSGGWFLVRYSTENQLIAKFSESHEAQAFMEEYAALVRAARREGGR